METLDTRSNTAMSIHQRACVLCFVCLVLVQLGAAKDLPAVRVSTVPPQLEGAWIASPIVAVGDVTNIVNYGHQWVQHLPPPTSPEVHALYWCLGDFHVLAVVKGVLRGAVRKYLWASTIPGCKLVDNSPKLIYHKMKTKFWFLREEGQFLRPTFDYNAPRFDGVFAAWSARLPLSPQQQLGTLLLTPTANANSLEEYARYLWNVGDTACQLLSKTECTRRIRYLATLGDPALRASACSFLKQQLGTDCKTK